MKEFIAHLPKAELHLHIEGTLEPELMFALAKRNNIELPYKNIDEVKQAYQFSNLQSFLDIYYQASKVLIHEEDFYDLTHAYIQKIVKQQVEHVEIFFDPQTHLGNNIPFEIVLQGIHRALLKATQEFNISTHLIACFLRDQSEEDALEVFKKVCQHQDKIIGIGLDSAEKGNPPSKFKKLFEQAKSLGFKRVAHAGEEGPAEYIWEAIQILDTERIDHGVACIKDDQLMDYLAKTQLPLTVCPLSNVKLKVFNLLQQHPLKKMLDANICVTINSDDPAYFGGYINNNFDKAQEALGLSKQQIITLAKNSFTASFITSERKEYYLSKIEEYSKY